LRADVVEYGIDDEGATVTFTLHDGAGATFGGNPQDWAVERRTDEG